MTRAKPCLALLLFGCHTEQSSLSDTALSMQAPIPQTLWLSVDGTEGGAPITFTTTGLPPGTSVRLVRAVGGSAVPGPCPPVLGGECLDIDGPSGVAVTGPAFVADASGTATLSATLPPSVADGTQIAFQVVAPSLLQGSNVVQFIAAPPLDCVRGERTPPTDALCVAGYPEVIPYSEFSLGDMAMCGGTGTTSGFGYSNIFQEIGFEIDLDTPFVAGDLMILGFTGWASGSSGVVAPVVDVSTDNQSWVYAGELPARDFAGNSTRDEVELALPLGGDRLFVRLTTPAPTSALIFARGFDASVLATCP